MVFPDDINPLGDLQTSMVKISCPAYCVAHVQDYSGRKYCDVENSHHDNNGCHNIMGIYVFFVF